MIKNNRIWLILIFILCVIAGGCAGLGDTEDGYYSDDSIGDAGLDGIKNMILNGKKSKGDTNGMEDSTEIWYEQGGRLARIRITNLKGKTYLRYDIEGRRTETGWHGGEISVQKEEDGTYIYSIDMNAPFYPSIRYDPEEDILLARDTEGTETIFKRTKFVPDADELQKKADEYPAPDESFCGTWHAPETVKELIRGEWV